MSNSNINIDEIKKFLLKETPFIDVRASIEFAQGSLPGAVNIPILNNEERALIGTTYKKKGQDEAVRLGYQIVSGSVKEERIARWSQFIEKNPETVLYCFRGGKRSQITQQWLKDAGIHRPLIVGGYKAARLFLMSSIEKYSDNKELLVVSGPTGSGKTLLIHEANYFYPSVDLEGLAHHRGSAFGAWSIPQPSQIDFENNLAVSLLKVEQRISSDFNPHLKLLVEDESRLIGKSCLPDVFFNRLRESQVIWLDEPLETRVDNIFKDYILDTSIGAAYNATIDNGKRDEHSIANAMNLFENYKKALTAISKKLGGLRTQEVMIDLENARLDFEKNNEIKANKIWIEKLLKYYYDPLYLKSLERRQVQVLFKGAKSEVIQFLKNLKT